MNDPMKISYAEWREIMDLEAIRESWGLEPEATVEEFASLVYGVKFDFLSGSPGYCGDLYILQGAYLTGDPPFVLIRNQDLIIINQD
jgi:hypothetical protein